MRLEAMLIHRVIKHLGVPTHRRLILRRLQVRRRSRVWGMLGLPGGGGGVGTAVVETLSSVHAAIPPVLDGVVASAMQSASNLGPPLAHLGDHPLNQDTLLGRDGIQVQRRLEILVEPLTALLGRPGLHELRDAHPIVSSVTVDQIEQILIFGLGPGAPTVLDHHACTTGVLVSPGIKPDQGQSPVGGRMTNARGQGEDVKSGGVFRRKRWSQLSEVTALTLVLSRGEGFCEKQGRRGG